MNTFRFRIFFFLISFTGFIIAVSGCTKSNIIEYPLPDEIVQEKRLTLEVMGHSSESFDEQMYDLEHYESLYPDTTIVVRPYNSESLTLKLKTDFATGQASDVFAVWPGNLIKNLMRFGMLFELTPYLDADEDWKNRFQYPLLWNAVTYEDRIYGLPIEGITEQLCINKELFEKNHLAPPETLDDLIEVCRQFHDRGITPLDISSWPDLSFLYQGLVCTHGERDDIINPKENPTENPYVEALHSLILIYQAGGFSLDSVVRLDTLRTGAALSAGKAAMMFNGSWSLWEMFNDMGANLELIPFPREDIDSQSSIIFGLGSTTYYISEDPQRNERKTEELIHFVKHITTSRAISLAMDQEYVLSNVPLIEKPSLTDVFPALLTMSDTHFPPPDHSFDRNNWYERILYRIPSIVLNHITPEQLWEEYYSVRVARD